MLRALNMMDGIIMSEKRYEATLKCAECRCCWNDEGDTLTEIVERANQDGCPYKCEGGMIYLMGHKDRGRG